MPSCCCFSDVSPPALYDVVAAHIQSDLCQRKRRKFYHGHIDLRRQSSEYAWLTAWGLVDDFNMKGLSDKTEAIITAI